MGDIEFKSVGFVERFVMCMGTIRLVSETKKGPMPYSCGQLRSAQRTNEKPGTLSVPIPEFASVFYLPN